MDLENIVVDITQRNYNIIQTIQYDVDSRYVNVKIVSSGKNVDLTNYMVSIACKKPDGKIVFNETEMVEPKQGLIKFLISEQISVALGEVVCELKIYGKNSSVLTTQYFTINVTQPIADKAIQSTNEFRQLTVAMNDYNEWVDKVKDKYNGLEEEYAEELTSVKSGLEETNAQLSKIAILFNNGEDIQDKLNQLGSNVTVKFAKETYEVDQPYTINNKTNITFDLSDATFIQRKHGYCVFELSNCSDIEIIGGEIVGAGNFYPQTVNNVTKLLVNEKCGRDSDWGKSKNGENSSTKTPYNGGYLTNVGYGILLIEGNSNVTISGTECRDFNYVGIGVGHIGKIDGEINRNITVQNCHCHGNFSAGMHFMHVDGFVATGNYCENNGHPNANRNDFDCNPGYGITCRSSVARPVNGVIANNICKNNKRKGIDVHAGNHVLIKGNMIEDCYRWGIALTRYNAPVDNIQVIDNTIRSCAYKEGGAGIICDSGGYNIIDGNKIYGSAIESNAIYCLDTNATVTNNVIIDSSTTGDTAHAVLIWNSEVDFIGNAIRESGSKTCVRAYPRNRGTVNIKDNRIFHSTNVHKIFNSVLTDTDNANVNVIGNTISGNESESVDFQSLKNTSGIIDGNIFNGRVYLDDSCDFIIGATNKGFKASEKKSKTMPVGTVTSTCIVTITNGVITFVDNNHVVTNVTNHNNGLTIHVGDKLIKGISWMYDGTDTQDVTDVRLRGIYTNHTADFSLYKTNGSQYGNPSTDFTKSRLAFIVSVI